MVENPGKRGGHVFIGHGLTAGAVLQDKGIITLAAQYIRQRKPFVQRTDIAKASTRKNQGKGRTGLASVIKQAGSLLLFPLRIERIKHGLAGHGIIYHAVQSSRHNAGPHMTMPGHKPADFTQRQTALCVTGTRHEMFPKSGKRGMVHHIGDSI